MNILDLMEIRKIDMPARRRRIRAFAIFIPLLFLFSFIAGFAEEHPIIGCSTLYIIISAVPFLFGLYWESNLLTRHDHFHLQKKFSLSYIISIAIVISLFNTAIHAMGGKYHSNSDAFIQMIESFGVLTAALSAIEYPPFFLGRMISQRTNLHRKNNP